MTATKKDPKPYQISGAKQIHRFKGRALLADEMGLGKTFTALFYAKKTNRKRIVIVTPAVAKYDWEDEAHGLGYRTQVLDGRKPTKKQPFDKSANIFIINYDILEQWVPYLRALDPELIIMDEVHYIKGYETGRFRACEELCEGMPRIIGVSGTPATNNPTELWAFLHLIMPKKFKSFHTFAMRYTNPVWARGRWKYEGSRNLDKLHKWLKRRCMIRRLKDDVLKHEIKPTERKVIHIPIVNRGEYLKAAADFMTWLKSYSPAKAKRAEKNTALVKVGYMLRLAAKLKHKFVIDWIETFLRENPEKKLVVFTGHTKVIQSLHKKFFDISVKVDGSVVGRKRKEAVNIFQGTPKCRLFLGNYRAAGVSLTLTKAQDLACVDLPWTPGELKQAEKRIDRIGQHGTPRIWIMLATNTIEEAQCRTLHRKQETLNAIFDGVGKGDNLSILTEMLGEMSQIADRAQPTLKRKKHK